MSDWTECAGCKRRIYLGFIPVERWPFKGVNGELYCDGLCRKQNMTKDDWLKIKNEISEKEKNVKMQIEEHDKKASENRIAMIDKIAESENGDKKAARKSGSTHDRTVMRKNMGLCTYCGNPNDNPNADICTVCVQKRKEQRKRAADKCAKAGVCHRCHTPVPIKNDGKYPYYCEACARKKREQNARRKASCE